MFGFLIFILTFIFTKTQIHQNLPALPSTISTILNHLNHPKTAMLFKETTSDPGQFFELLPADWQAGIVPYWPDYQETARIFILEKNQETVGGGIVFSTVSPDTMAYREEAQTWLDRGYLYIAFLFVPEKFRGQQLGTKWLQSLHRQFPGQPFWLSVEDKGLVYFYEKNGFTLVKQVEGEWGAEWILATAAP